MGLLLDFETSTHTLEGCCQMSLLITEIEDMFEKKVPPRNWPQYQCGGVITSLYGEGKENIGVRTEEVERGHATYCSLCIIICQYKICDRSYNFMVQLACRCFQDSI
jgi:hypothetical protein